MGVYRLYFLFAAEVSDSGDLERVFLNTKSTKAHNTFSLTILSDHNN